MVGIGVAAWIFVAASCMIRLAVWAFAVAECTGPVAKIHVSSLESFLIAAAGVGCASVFLDAG